MPMMRYETWHYLHFATYLAVFLLFGHQLSNGADFVGNRSAQLAWYATGDVIDTWYGPVQVAVTLAKGRLTAVHVLRVPSESGRDQEIAARAVPRLTEGALGAQNAQIDAVSGAGYTSEGYIQSLQSALDKAGA